MEKFTGKTCEEYKEYARKRRNKSVICRVYDKEFIEYKQKQTKLSIFKTNETKIDKNIRIQ